MDLSNITYLAFGDSITYGADHANNYAKMPEPYPELVCAELGLRCVKNLGISGATLVRGRVNRACMTDRILSSELEGELISVLLGVNDYADSSPLGTPDDKEPDTVWGALDCALRHLTKKYPQATIFIMTPYETCIKGVPGTEKNSAGYTLPDVAHAVREVARRYGVPVLDLYRDGGYADEIALPTSDGIHPSPSFVKQRTAPQVAAFIRKILAEREIG
jgi:lysophospholipase L1-like esterase